MLAGAIRDAGHKNVFYFASMREGIEKLIREARPGDAVLTIGAGSVSRASNELVVLLGAHARLPEVAHELRRADTSAHED